ncbi:hypothetical protein FRB90_002258 [Tulasnella sp. 427]|nr:hypothetical protein FRB90_002258 [Tulasnella sp. 427]
MTTIYSGALQPKKKHELQALAADLGLDNTGTKDDVQERIKSHLASNQELAQDERFAGLYSRKRVVRALKESSAQPPDVPSGDDVHHAMTRRSSQRIFPSPDSKRRLTEVPEPEPESEQAVAEAPQPPSSPVRSMIQAFNKAVAAAPEAEVVKQIVEERGKQAYAEADRALINARTLLSNAKNISTITIFAELLFAIYTFVPWAYYDVPLNAPYRTHYDGPVPPVAAPSGAPLVSTRILHVPYPPGWFLQTLWPYTTVLLWLIPTVILPQLVGTLVSFRPATRGAVKGDGEATEIRQAGGEADPLTAAIIRVACVFAGDWGLNWSTIGIDKKWRVLGSSVAAAFALAEAVGERKAALLAAGVIEEEVPEEEPQERALTLRKRAV